MIGTGLKYMFLWSSSQTDCLYLLWPSTQSKQTLASRVHGWLEVSSHWWVLPAHCRFMLTLEGSLWFGKALWVSFSCELASYGLKLIDSWIDYNGIHEVWRPAQGAALCKHTIGGSKQKDNAWKAAANVIFCWVLLCKLVQKKWEGFFWCNANGT